MFTSTFLRKNPLTRQTRCTLKPLSCKLEWTNQKHFYRFFLKPVRDNLAPGFPRALDLSLLHAQTSSGSRLLPTKTNKLRLSCRKKGKFETLKGFGGLKTYLQAWEIIVSNSKRKISSSSLSSATRSYTPLDVLCVDINPEDFSQSLKYIPREKS